MSMTTTPTIPGLIAAPAVPFRRTYVERWQKVERAGV